MDVRSQQREIGIGSAVQRYLGYLLLRDDLAVIASVSFQDFCSPYDLNRLADDADLHRDVDSLPSAHIDGDLRAGERTKPSLFALDRIGAWLDVEKVVVAGSVRCCPY